ANKLFTDLQGAATTVNVYNNPQLRETMPGVVATVNGDRITMQQLGKECLLRHGEEVLDLEISHLLLRQAVERSGVAVTDGDIEAEMRHAAEISGVVDAKGDADLVRWKELATTEQGVDFQQYVRDAVWPSAALKKLTSQSIEVTQEDIRKGFEANYGERVRVRAIVLDNMRRAQEVWKKARQTETLEHFGSLAEEYSVEPTSKALRGEVPPLQRFGGQPQLEEVAFRLQPGQISEIVNVGQQFIILRCEGRTKRVDVDEDVVRKELYRDIFEKKLRIAMGKKFEEIQANARVDNYLAGISNAPAKRADANPPPVRRDAAVRRTSGQQPR
ncbi:MAG: peptidylprolyl isomerase, partial [Planctomycetota bacterium]